MSGRPVIEPCDVPVKHVLMRMDKDNYDIPEGYAERIVKETIGVKPDDMFVLMVCFASKADRDAYEAASK